VRVGQQGQKTHERNLKPFFQSKGGFFTGVRVETEDTLKQNGPWDKGKEKKTIGGESL